MDDDDPVPSQYGGPNIFEAIIAALTRAGVDCDHLTAADLFPLDQLHAGFADATRFLIKELELTAEDTLLDVGCGIGGPARLGATITPARVVGVDPSRDFVSVARRLTDRVGLADRVQFEIATGDRLPFDDDRFTAATMIHVGMNVADKAAVFTEVHRVLRPGARFMVFDQMRVGPGDLTFPLPWAADERTSFVATPDDYLADLTLAGFGVGVVDRTAPPPGGPPAPPGGLSPAVYAGPDFADRIANNVAATRAGMLSPVVITAVA